MTAEIKIWNQIIKNLESSITPSEIKTWFSNTECSRLDDNIAIIDVPNKFIATWLRDNYSGHLKKSFKKIINETPELIFNYKNKNIKIIKKDNKKHKNNNFSHNLNKLMNFNNFVLGDCNQFAYSSAVEIARKPGDYYNPFYIFSRYGVGKTHLLNSIGNSIIEKDKALNIAYIHSKEYLSEYNNASRKKSFDEFKNKYNNSDILLFDDIQYLSNSYKLQDVFISLFNNYYSQKKQIVITGDRPPKNFKKFNSQLQSRLGCGLLTEIKEIDNKTKTKIINNYLKNKNIILPNDIINYLIKSNNDIKIIFKNIIRIETYISLNKRNINLSVVKSLIKDRYDLDINIRDIQSVIAGYFNISIDDLISDKKKSIYSYPRHLAMYMCRKFTDLSYKEIGYLFGDKDHSTVIYAVNKVKKSIKEKNEMPDDINNITNLLT